MEMDHKPVEKLEFSEKASVFESPVLTDELVPEMKSKDFETKKNSRINLAVGSTSLFLALLALLVAIIAIYLSTHETNIADSNYNLLKSTFSQQQALQTEIDNSTNEVTHLKAELTTLKSLLGLQIEMNSNATADLRQNDIPSLQAKLKDSAKQISILQDQLSICNEKNTQQDAAFTSLTSILSVSPVVFPGSFLNPARSCREIPQDKPSGEYWILKQTGTSSSLVKVYCEMNRTSCSCNTTGGWMKVANLDMTDPTHNCPDGFNVVSRTSAPLRTCGRSYTGCVSTTFLTYGVTYSRVCGRVIGYQDRSPAAFFKHGYRRGTTIDSNYVDGVSLTHGQSPWQHIWTFAGAANEQSTTDGCPCTQPGRFAGKYPPSFVDQDYFCDTGSRDYHGPEFYPDDPLWDGQGCGGNSTCCEFNNPPWFCKRLPQPTTNDITMRLCGDEDTGNEDTPIEIVELFVQ